MKLLFPKLFDYCRDKRCTVSDCWRNEEWVMDFRRSLSLEEADQWEELLDTIKEVEISNIPDRVTWALKKLGQYTTRLMYRMLAHMGVINYRMRRIWSCKIPMKLMLFLWLETGVNLKRKKWKGDHRCAICGVPETTDHILFKCILAKFTWSCVKEALGWGKIPIGVQNFMDGWEKRGVKIVI